MKFEYPNAEASQWAQKIYDGLIARGHLTAVLDAKQRQWDVEMEIDSNISSIFDLYHQRRYEVLLQLLVTAVQHDAIARETFSGLLSMLKRGETDILEKVEHVLGIGMEQLRSDGVYTFEYPIDLIIALDALFRQAVAGPMFAAEANRHLLHLFNCRIWMDWVEGDQEYLDDVEPAKFRFRKCLKLFASHFEFEEVLLEAGGSSEGPLRYGDNIVESLGRNQAIKFLRAACMEVIAA